MEYLFSGAVFVAVLLLILQQIRIKQRETFIAGYAFPQRVSTKIKETYPHLSDGQIERVLYGLREYFAICNTARRRMVSMPSQVVDVAWHEFILFTRNYKQFCKRGIGRFLHHTPAEAMSSPTIAQDGIKRAWRLACSREKIDPRTPHRLPLLFGLDTELGIPNGFTYSLNCTGRDNEYCAGHIGCGGGRAGDGCGGDGGGCGGD